MKDEAPMTNDQTVTQAQFEREERYIVFKKSHLTQRQLDMLDKLILPPTIPPANWHDDHTLPTVECVVVEKDWPEYETVWKLIEARMTAHSGEGNGAGEDDVVEKIARIIAPSAWAVFDAEKSRMLRKYKGENIGWPADQYQHKASMDTARTIIAALSAPPASAAGMREALERAKEAFEQIGIIASGCATTHGDPGGGLEMIAGYASDGFAALAHKDVNANIGGTDA